MTEIQDNAFYGCEYLQTVKIPNSVIFLGNNAFYNCGILHTVYFEGNAPKAANGAFGPELGSESSLTIYYHNNTEGWSDIWDGCYTSTYHKYMEYGDYYFKINDEGTATITKYIGSEEEVVIPTEINGIKVTAIGYAFET